jgi:ubiquinone/menaquinone biosynthesis C-methylase UbiE
MEGRLPDDSFDAVIGLFSVFFIPQMVKQLAELWRMLLSMQACVDAACTGRIAA